MVTKKLTDVERRFIRSGGGSRALQLYRRRTLRLVASLIASPALRGREHLDAKVRLLEIYRMIAGSNRGLAWMERAYLSLSELAELLREGLDDESLMRLLGEIREELEGPSGEI